MLAGIMDDPQHNCPYLHRFLHICHAAFKIDGPDDGHVGRGGDVRVVDAAAALRLRYELSDVPLWGLVGGAVVLNTSRWFIVVAQLIYIFGGACGRAWTGFSWKAFQNLSGFVQLSLASAVMLW
ncbi:hypothetical protein Nepgr_006014 [Nepenthes gracilis]|uniref:Uncharacterized protein n=1 Tax=Nepenthes gracilis TaxID=150966 RepID=A0AAD3S4S1_NEPGR|nr:hypothetical protein Nepgr_006014 [Nepenthes gracilis]